MRYLKIQLFPEDDDSLNAILDGMRSTVDREPIVDENGVTFIEILSDTELMAESFCLGMCYSELEEDGIADPFSVEVVELDVEPIDIGRKVN